MMETEQPYEKIFKIIYHEDEITWQRILYELVKSEQMDPWDINVSLLSKKYIDTIKKLKEADLRLSGKVLLAAAILLKIKSNRLLNEDLSEFDRLLSEPQDLLGDDLGLIDAPVHREKGEVPPLIPRSPQPRKRKVSIYDLMNALEKALEVKNRRVLNSIPPLNISAPRKTVDISQVIRDVYGRIKDLIFNEKRQMVHFSSLVASKDKDSKIFTFIPLLHLSSQQKINMEQKEHFGEIEITLASQRELNEIEEGKSDE